MKKILLLSLIIFSCQIEDNIVSIEETQECYNIIKSIENAGEIWRISGDGWQVDFTYKPDLNIGECVDINARPDYCNHPLIVGYFDKNFNVVYYDFSKC